MIRYAWNVIRYAWNVIWYAWNVIRYAWNSGNHESKTMNEMYGFDGEVKAKYSSQMSELFTELFNWLPLAHCIERKILVSSRHRFFCIVLSFNLHLLSR